MNNTAELNYNDNNKLLLVLDSAISAGSFQFFA